jgi:hypothetical protein
LAEEVFKNVRVLRGISVDEFMGTMGVFSAALGISCADCHMDSDANWEAYALDTVSKKVTARRMIQMVTNLNKASFGGRQVVTCYTCHRGSDRPKVTPSLARLYGDPPPEEADDVVKAASGGGPTLDQVLDKYLQAIGGAARVGALTSYVAKGMSAGYGPESVPRPIEIFAKAPAQRTVIIHTLDGDSTTTYDGSAGWMAAPHKPLPLLSLTKGELDGARLDAQMMFPGGIKQLLRDSRVGVPTELEGRDVQVVQGTSPAGTLMTLFFDRETGLLARSVRYADSPVGRLPTQTDYSDYRDVAGVKLPFKLAVKWLDGLETMELSEVRTNVTVEASKFGKPAPAPAGK